MDRELLLAAIAAQEQLRGVVPDEMVDSVIGSLRAQLKGLSEPAKRRRQATVLFADVTGFTAMSESMDPELVAGLMNRLWERLDAAVIANGGRVDKHIGDALMAVWGTDATAEDDAERGVRAALALQAEIEEFRVTSGRDLAIRVGVNTGAVLLGPVGSNREFTAMGDAVNTASRLEHAAPTGGVLISHDTYRQIRGVFDVVPLEPLTVKGKPEPLRVYSVQAAKARAFRLRSRGVEGIETSSVGRDREFSALWASFEEVMTSGRCRPVVVVGEAGVGKSRLLYEFDNWLELHETSVFYFKARATRSRQATRFGLWRDLMAFRSGVTESDSPEAVLKKLRAETAPALDAKEALILGLWMGFEISDPTAGSGVVSGENMAVVGRAHFAAYLRFLMSQSPVVMLFEDIHWADGESLELVRNLPEVFADARLLIVAASRPVQVNDAALTDFLGPAWTLVELGSLSADSARLLVLEILKRADGVSDALVDLIVDRADGNPFYIEEMIKKLMDDGVIDAADPGGPWTIRTELLDTASIPSTLTGLLQARLDALPPDSRRSLQRASVIGRTFWDGAIEMLGSEAPDLLPALSNELIFSQRSSAFPPSSEFTFKHALLHDVAYDTVLLSERPTLHERTAGWLATVAADRRDEYLEEIAGHLLLAGLDDQAAELLFEAAERALNAGDAPSARRLAEAGFAAGGSSSLPPRAHLVLARACRSVGDLANATKEAEQAIRRADETTDDAATVEAIQEAFYVAEIQGAHEQCHSLVNRGLPIAERLGGSSLSQMLVCFAINALNTGELEEAARSAAASLEAAETEGSTRTLINAHNASGAVAGAVGDHEAWIAHLEQILTLANRSGDLLSVTNCHLNTGVTWHYLADSNESSRYYERAEVAYEASLALSKRLGLRTLEVRGLGNLSQLRIRQRRLGEAQMLARQCLDIAVEIGLDVDARFAILVHAEAKYEDTGSLDSLQQIGGLRADRALGRLAIEVAEVIERLREAHPDVDIDHSLDAGASLVLEDVVRRILDG